MQKLLIVSDRCHPEYILITSLELNYFSDIDLTRNFELRITEVLCFFEGKRAELDICCNWVIVTEQLMFLSSMELLDLFSFEEWDLCML